MSGNSYTVKIAPLGEADLESIYVYFFAELQEKEIADKVTNLLKASILGLSDMPKSHPLAQESRLRKKGIHKLICENYVIPFLIDEKDKVVFVVRVFHGKMNYQKYL